MVACPTAMLDFSRFSLMAHSSPSERRSIQRQCALPLRGKTRRRKTRHKKIPTTVALALMAMLAFAACGTHNSALPPIAVAFTPGFTPPTSMTAGSNTGIAATITNDNRTGTVAWSVTCSDAPCGSFSPTSTPSTTPTTYTAPATAPTGGSVTITTTSNTDKTKSVSAVITIT